MAEVANSGLFQNIEGIQKLKDAFVVLVKTEWNADITNELEKGCILKLGEYGIQHLTLIAPGAIEIPFVISQYAANQPLPSAFIALGCIIKGDTPHFEYVCQSVTQGITLLNLSAGAPVIFGILTVNELQQAKDRAGGKHGHKGEEAAITSIKMMVLHRSLKDAIT